MPLEDVTRLVDSIQLNVEEIFSWLSEDPSIGDDGVAEATIAIENDVSLLQGRLRKKVGA